MKALLHKPKWIPKQRRRENDGGDDVDPEKVKNGGWGENHKYQNSIICDNYRFTQSKKRTYTLYHHLVVWRTIKKALFLSTRYQPSCIIFLSISESFHSSILGLQSVAAASFNHSGMQASQDTLGRSADTSLTHLSAKEFPCLLIKHILTL
jgi:hypothetical protein